MSAVATLSRNQPHPDGCPDALPAPVEFHYAQTDSFVTLLHQLRASLLNNSPHRGKCPI